MHHAVHDLAIRPCVPLLGSHRRVSMVSGADLLGFGLRRDCGTRMPPAGAVQPSRRDSFSAALMTLTIR